MHLPVQVPQHERCATFGALGTRAAGALPLHQVRHRRCQRHGGELGGLALAIALATLNNFTWNRLWTWSDRVKTLEAGEVQPVSLRLLGMEFGQYVTASAFGSGMQYVLTLLLSGSMDYRLANIIAIVAASVSNFLANDRWTFKRSRD
jgi:putative flippase GtrA